MDRASLTTDVTHTAGLAFKSTKQLCHLASILPNEPGQAITLKADVRALHQMIILFQQSLNPYDPWQEPPANYNLFLLQCPARQHD
ncbi:uncharacterized protein N7483_004810 [Penicillium malachiteum]|uniref:uncharacterized protein n=1 Tax=Penicillium malachiteum TaxID=1324776 RepID=UPI002548310D|nr:uncharacterized protein N7483_004810 [Penicillium malachiteum]KAJ5730302.1 hypothetical protein N7483_004810 [Penicillium malachiteum]